MNINSEFLFSKIHISIKMGNYNYAIKLIYDWKSDKIKFPFCNDLNHSFYLLGECFYKRKLFLRSIHFYWKSFLVDKNDWMSLAAIADSNFQLRRIENSVYFYKKSIEIYEDDRNIYYLANVFFHSGNYSEAISYYKKIPEKSNLYFNSINKIDKIKEKF